MDFLGLETRSIPVPLPELPEYDHLGQGRGQDFDPLAMAVECSPGVTVTGQVKLEPMDSKGEVEAQQQQLIGNETKMSLRVRENPTPGTRSVPSLTEFGSQFKTTTHESVPRLRSKSKVKIKPEQATRRSSRRKITTDSNSRRCLSKIDLMDSKIKDLLSEYCESNCKICDELILKLSQHFIFHQESEGERDRDGFSEVPVADPDHDDPSDPDYHPDPEAIAVDMNLPGDNIKIEYEYDAPRVEHAEPPKKKPKPVIGRKKKKKRSSEHIYSKKDRIRLTCDLCTRKCNTQALLDEHRKTHSTYISPNSNSGADEASKQSNFLDDITTKALQLVGVSVPVPTSSVLPANLNLANQNYDKAKPYSSNRISCTLCPTVFYNPAKLQKHYQDVHDPSKINYRCTICAAEFGTVIKLNRHFKSSHPEAKFEPYVCSICSKGFTNMCFLKTHLKEQHCSKSEIPGAFKCEYEGCNKAFLYKPRLENHVRVCHTRETPFLCSTCGKAFCSRNSLHMHTTSSHVIGNSTKEKCHVCNKGFKDKYHLDQHMLTHTGERPHICDQCGKGFTQKNILNTHYKLHTGERPHKCQGCGKGFIRHVGLRLHLKSRGGSCGSNQ